MDEGTLPQPELGRGAGSLHDAIADLFRLYDPNKLSSVVDLVAEFGGDEEGLKARLEKAAGVPGFFAAQHLHFASRFFDAPRALYDESFVPPYPDARPLDNVSKAACLLPADGASRPLLGKLHADMRGESDAAWWRGDVPATLLDWLAAALPPGPASACLQPWVKEKARVRVLTRQASPDGGSNLCAWSGHIKGADADGNVLLVGVERTAISWVRMDAAAGERQEGAAAGGPQQPAPSERLMQVVLVGDSILSVARERERGGEGRSAKADLLHR
jgi:hypothetical protein